jgi:divalent metal cation (Fe/Co/Zn/Cd) transporter
MALLATLKRRAAANLGGSEFRTLARLVRADAAETQICGILSLSTLLGIVLVASVGWWWADPLASLVVIVIALREGRDAWNCEPS